VLCSTALRARATLGLVAGGLGTPETEIEGGLYVATATDLLERLREVPEGVTQVLLVGHNPSLQELVCMLAPPGAESFPTGALAELRLTIESWQEVRPGCARLEGLVVPRSLPG
jgi:phosphohistidine phosphatase